MEPPSARAVVLVRFPFSDLSGSKLRPALVLAATGRGDVLLCQITSNPWKRMVTGSPSNWQCRTLPADRCTASVSLDRVSALRPMRVCSRAKSLG